MGMCLLSLCLVARAQSVGGGSANAPATQPAKALPYIVGADISWVQAAEERGMKYSEGGVQKDILEILKGHGFNFIRLRTFVDPTKRTPSDRPYSAQGYCDLPHTIAMAKRVKAAEMGLLIDFHYSDSWADPKKQHVPSAWADLTFDGLEQKVREYTQDAVTQLKNAGAAPDMVQIGNEITPGMMTDGAEGGGSTKDWVKLGRLLKAGVAGAKAAEPSVVIMLHIDRGGDNRRSREWVDKALAQGVPFDVLGQSCYGRWQGPAEGWKKNFEDLAARYPQLKFVMAEVDAQAVVANDIMKSLPDGRGLGTFIWEPTANNAGQALFDNRGAVIEAKIKEYDEVVKKYGLPTGKKQ
jgi:arabinogalactan endo-1,4-beta-galactosidase